MVEISLSGSGEGLGRGRAYDALGRGYSTPGAVHAGILLEFNVKPAVRGTAA